MGENTWTRIAPKNDRRDGAGGEDRRRGRTCYGSAPASRVGLGGEIRPIRCASGDAPLPAPAEGSSAGLRVRARVRGSG